MDYKKRILPTQSEFMELSRRTGSAADDAGESEDSRAKEVEGIDFIVHFLATADVLRERLFAALQQDFGLSEGRFVLLTALKVRKTPQPLTTLAAFTGVSPATCSVMVKRMLAEKEPLICRHGPEPGSKKVLISLTPAGEETADKALRQQHQRCLELARLLPAEELPHLLAVIKGLYNKLP